MKRDNDASTLQPFTGKYRDFTGICTYRDDFLTGIGGIRVSLQPLNSRLQGLSVIATGRINVCFLNRDIPVVITSKYIISYIYSHFPVYSSPDREVTGISLFIVQLTRKLRGFPCFCNSFWLLQIQGNPRNFLVSCTINREIPVTLFWFQFVVFFGKKCFKKDQKIKFLSS